MLELHISTIDPTQICLGSIPIAKCDGQNVAKTVLQQLRAYDHMLDALKMVKVSCELNKRTGSVIYGPVCKAIELAENSAG